MEPEQGVSLALAGYLRAGARRPFAWGRCDCSLWMADWVRLRRGIDPAAPLRGRYRTARGAARHIRRMGGAEAMARTLAAEAGLAVTAAPAVGDIGLVRHPLAGPCFAIRCALGWALKAPAGIAVADCPVIVAWSV